MKNIFKVLICLSVLILAACGGEAGPKAGEAEDQQREQKTIPVVPNQTETEREAEEVAGAPFGETELKPEPPADQAESGGAEEASGEAGATAGRGAQTGGPPEGQPETEPAERAPSSDGQTAETSAGGGPAGSQAPEAGGGSGSQTATAGTGEESGAEASGAAQEEPAAEPDAASQGAADAQPGTEAAASIDEQTVEAPEAKTKDSSLIKQLEATTGALSGAYDKELNGYTAAYLAHFLNQAADLLNHLQPQAGDPPALAELKAKTLSALRSLCHDSLCLKIDYSRLDREKAARLIHAVGVMVSGMDFLAQSAEHKFELLGLLHGPPVNSQNPQPVRDFTENIKTRHIKAIAVNLPFVRPQPPDSFFHLGQFIQQEGIGLHIIGACEGYCAHYLLPAAAFVHIGPYGRVSMQGSQRGFGLDIGLALTGQQTFIVSGRIEPALLHLFEQIAANVAQQARGGGLAGSGGGFSANQTIELAAKVSEDFANHPEKYLLRKLIQDWGAAHAANDGAALLSALERRAAARGVNHILEIPRSGRADLFAALSPYELKMLKGFVYDTSQAARQQASYMQALAGGGEREGAYFQQINAPGPYIRLMDLTALLVQNKYYESVFFMPRAFYNVPEEEKPWIKAAPSAELLKSAGLRDVRGENNTNIIDIIYPDLTDKILPLTAESIERCGFQTDSFGGGGAFVAYKTEDLKGCLFSN